MTPVAELKVTSHVGRDLLQSAALFKHEHAVVWEYVSNGLEYVDPDVCPVVDVTVDAKGNVLDDSAVDRRLKEMRRVEESFPI